MVVVDVEQGKFIGDGPQIKDAWDLAVQAAELKLAANVDLLPQNAIGRTLRDWLAAVAAHDPVRKGGEGHADDRRVVRAGAGGLLQHLGGPALLRERVLSEPNELVPDFEVWKSLGAAVMLVVLVEEVVGVLAMVLFLSSAATVRLRPYA